MWFNESQMSGDVIYMKTDFETKNSIHYLFLAMHSSLKKTA